jgi:hypothetical protein
MVHSVAADEVFLLAFQVSKAGHVAAAAHQSTGSLSIARFGNNRLHSSGHIELIVQVMAECSAGIGNP